jgi:hypothetical protein
MKRTPRCRIWWWRGYAGAWGWEACSRQGRRKQFFFEKKNQKTFTHCGHPAIKFRQ